MPEPPEVETARKLIADAALHRRIVAVDDTDTFVCRPHAPGELRAALTRRTLIAAHRRGKTMWCETSGLEGPDSGEKGPDLGIHLGMGGRIVVTDSDGDAAVGGDPLRRTAAQGRVGPVHADVRRRRQPGPVRQAPARPDPAQPRYRRARSGCRG